MEGQKDSAEALQGVPVDKYNLTLRPLKFS